MGRRRMCDRPADDAVEGLPMTMVIVMVILAITIPLVFGSFRIYDCARVEAELISEIADFTAMAQMLYTSGPGNSAVMEFSAAGGALASVETVIFGDAPASPLISTVRYTLRDRPEVVVPVNSPAVPMMSSGSDTAYSLGAGTYEITVECCLYHADLNGDGMSPDACIRLGLAQ